MVGKNYLFVADYLLVKKQTKSQKTSKVLFWFWLKTIYQIFLPQTEKLKVSN